MPETPEQRARRQIDTDLTAAGWLVQNSDELDITAGRGIAVREFQMKSGFGFADYLLYLDRKAVGAIEAKPEGTLTGVEAQSAKYAAGLPDNLPAHKRPLPFLFESNGSVTYFTNGLDPRPRSRQFFNFPRPETLADWVGQAAQLRARLKQLPELDESRLWKVQTRAIRNLEESFAKADSRALIQMATGSGKTFTAVNVAYRLLKYGSAKRILFLVDRGNLGRQTEDEFANFEPADDPRKFPTLYTVQRLKTNSINPAAKVVITTIQRLYSMLKGETEFDAGNEEGSSFDSAKPWQDEPPDVVYNAGIPPEFFDFIIVDECHRSIYELWSQVLLYFDSFIIGLTATPAGKTIGFFNQNLVMQYGHDEAVTDGVNVDFDVYRIRTRITEQGATIAAGDTGVYVDKRHKLTRAERLAFLNQDLTYTANQLDRDVVSESQIRTVLQQFRDKVLPEAFPGRSEAPKTLIFAKDDSHADDIVRIVREVFAEGNEFCQKITYRTGFTKVTKKVKNDDGSESEVTEWVKTSNLTPDEILANFRNSFFPRIAVTVDMISTGTDVKPIECVFFLRNVKSAGFFEQMKGRGVRVISPDKLLDELFSDLDAGVAALERVREKLGLYRASLLKDAVEGVLTSEWRARHPHTEPASELLKRILAERRRRWEEEPLAKFDVKSPEPPKNWKAKYKEPVAPDTTDLPSLPEGWAIASMDAITVRITSGSRDWQQYYGSGSGTFIMAQNVRPGRYNPSIRQAVAPPPDDASCERSRVEKDDLLVTIVGANTGDVCRVPDGLMEHYVCQSVALMRPTDNRIASFLDHYCNSAGGAQLHYERYIYGAGRPHLSFDQLKMTPVLLPPLPEQEAIVEAVEDHLSIIEHLESDLETKLNNAQVLRQAILRHAFTGQLVPQDPKEEPASELLTRTAAEREMRARDVATTRASKPSKGPRTDRRQRSKKISQGID